MVNFQQPLIQSSGSRGPLEIILIYWFDAQGIFIIIRVVNSSAA